MSGRPWRFSYTYDDLAALVGWDRGQVMRSKRAGQFDPRSLEDVYAWVSRVRAGLVRPTRKRYGKERGLGSGA